MNIIIENQYFAPISLYIALLRNSNIVFEQCERYQKRSFRNRCIIAGANGPVTLSIPIEKGREQKTFTRDIRIANQYGWQDQHWKTILSSYNRSPWFEYYKDSLEVFYKKHFEFLIDWNMELFYWTLQKLEVDIVAEFTTDFIKNYDPKTWLDLRDKILPGNYTQFETPVYGQVFMDRLGFLPNLSILDLLFCEGRNSRRLLQFNNKAI